VSHIFRFREGKAIRSKRAAKLAETKDTQISLWRYVWPFAVAFVGAAIAYYFFVAGK
jgi:hypothetical protein